MKPNLLNFPISNLFEYQGARIIKNVSAFMIGTHKHTLIELAICSV